MPVFANGALLFYVVAIGCFARSQRRWIFWTLLGCFALLVTDTVFTVTQQLPVTLAVRALDPEHLTDLRELQRLRDATIEHFHLRGWLSISAFCWLTCAVVFSLGGQRIVPPQGAQS